MVFGKLFDLMQLNKPFLTPLTKVKSKWVQKYPQYQVLGENIDRTFHGIKTRSNFKNSMSLAKQKAKISKNGTTFN